MEQEKLDKKIEIVITLQNSFEKAINKISDEQLEVLFKKEDMSLLRVGLKMVTMSFVFSWLMDELGMEDAMEVWKSVAYLEDPEDYIKRREKWLKENE